MPVFEIGDLDMGELRPAVGLFGTFSGLADGRAGRAARAGGYILGVIAGRAPLISAWVLKSPSGLPTKSYPGH